MIRRRKGLLIRFGFVVGSWPAGVVAGEGILRAARWILTEMKEFMRWSSFALEFA